MVPSVDDGVYFLYGTTDPDCWNPPATGFDLYTSPDLECWHGPRPAFRPPPGFWADRNFWAPEVHRIGELWCMPATFKAPGHSRVVQCLASESLEGPFRLHGDGPVTPEGWECLDGTIAWQDGRPWLVFCREWLQVLDGEICALPLTEDGARSAGDPVVLFRASEAPWTRPVQERWHFVTDGPFLHLTARGTLLMLWSSFGPKGYAMGIARSRTGRIEGPWEHDRRRLVDGGGHGMLFTAFDGRLLLAYHAPNDTPHERPRFREVVEDDRGVRLRRPRTLLARLRKLLRSRRPSKRPDSRGRVARAHPPSVSSSRVARYTSR